MFDSFEIDFLPVGENSKSGDAITMRLGNYNNGVWENQVVIVIDGGDKQAGKKVIDHIQNKYGTNDVLLAFLTHPDIDHASGLREVCEKLNVFKVCMHRPWNHSDELADLCKDGRITQNSFSNRLKDAYKFASEVESIADNKGIEIIAPKQGVFYSLKGEPIITILGPSKEFYLSQIKESDKTPEMVLEHYIQMFSEAEQEMKIETMDFETENLAAEDIPTSAENNMSLIMLITVAGRRILLTADAGIDALYKAIQYSLVNNINLNNLSMFQVPHHGSRRNLSKGVLEYISAKCAIVSCSKMGAPKHPNPIVTNALIRRSIPTYQTKGSTITYYGGKYTGRAGNITAKAIEFTPKVFV